MDTLFAPHFPVSRLRTSAERATLPEVTLFLAPEEAGLKARLDAWMLKHNLTGSYGQVENQPVLRLRNAKAGSVITALQEDGLADGILSQEQSPEDKLPPPSFGQRFKENIVRLAAAVYIFSNTTLVLGGMKRLDQAKTSTIDAITRQKDIDGAKSQIATGLTFNAGDGLMLAFGHRSTEQQLDSVARRLGEFARGHSWSIPDSSPIHLADKRNKGFLNKLGNGLRENIITIKAAAEIIAGLLTIHTGSKQGNKGKILSGVLIDTGFILSQVVPERKGGFFRQQEEDKAEAHALGLGGKHEEPGFFTRAINAIKRKPMLLMGFFTIGNNASSLVGAFGENERRPDLKPYGHWKYDAVAQGAFIGANGLLAMSSKNNTQRASTIMEHAYGMASDLILCQPEDIRASATEKLAKFLARQPEVDATISEAKAALEAMVAAKACLLAPPAPERAEHAPLAQNATKELAAAEETRASMVERLELTPKKPLAVERQNAENRRPEPNTVPGEWRETVRGQEAQQEAHHYEGR